MSATSPTLVSFGELLWDMYPDEARLGGASANLAFHAAQLGMDSLLVSRVGRDALGAQALAELRQAGVDVSGVDIDERFPTGRVLVEVVEGEPRFTIAPGVAWDHIRPSPELQHRLRTAGALCFGTLAQRTPLVRGTLRALLAELSTLPSGPLRVLDLNLRPPFVDAGVAHAALEHAQVVKLNEAELTSLSALEGLPEATSGDPVRALLERPELRLVALTRGARGASLITPNERADHPGHPSSGADPVGAGDAFTAMLTRELLRGTQLPEIAERACRYAAWVASEPGGQPRAPAWFLEALA